MKPANTAELKTQRHGRLQTNVAPAAAAQSTTANGWRCASGCTTALAAPWAIWPTGRNMLCAHHSSSAALRAPKSGSSVPALGRCRRALACCSDRDGASA